MICSAVKHVGYTVLLCYMEIPHEYHYDRAYNLEWLELPDIHVPANVPSKPPLKFLEVAVA